MQMDDIVLSGNGGVENRKKITRIKQTTLNRKGFYLAEPHLY